MSMCIVRIPHVEVNLTGEPTVRIGLPSDYETNFASDRKGRDEIERDKDPDWIAEQIERILQDGKGHLATAKHPMRSFGAGILARVSSNSLGPDPVLVLQIRGSNRGSVWPLGLPIHDALCWKEFAGVTASPNELLHPEITAIKELYEEVAFLSDNEMLLPSDLESYPDSWEQVDVAAQRINRHYRHNLSPVSGFYPAVTRGDLEADSSTTVLIDDGRQEHRFNAIVNYNPDTNALEMSFIANIKFGRTLTGILSLSGPEDTNTERLPYMEDVIVVKEERVRRAKPGQRLLVRHLLSVHGPRNLAAERESFVGFVPAPTLVPLLWHLDNRYSLRNVLTTVRERMVTDRASRLS